MAEVKDDPLTEEILAGWERELSHYRGGPKSMEGWALMGIGIGIGDVRRLVAEVRRQQAILTHVSPVEFERAAIAAGKLAPRDPFR